VARTERQDPRDKLTEAHQHLAQAVADLVSGDDWQAFLALAAKLHGYSARNVLLILSQAPWATQVAGYRTWQQLGRQVRAGEKGIAILAPCRYRSAANRDQGDDAVSDDEAGCQPGRRVVRGFRVVYVFDVSSTDGDALAQPVRPQLLRGEAPAGLWDALAELVIAEGYTVERGDCGGANGLTRFDTRVVRIRDDVDDSQACRSLSHELGHVLLHDGTEYAAGCRGQAEVEAESVAYLVCSAAGIDADQYSFAYVAGWSGGDPAAVQAAAERVLACAQQITQQLVPVGEPATSAGRSGD
jgi:antirestriction protein ArdC